MLTVFLTPLLSGCLSALLHKARTTFLRFALPEEVPRLTLSAHDVPGGTVDLEYMVGREVPWLKPV